MRRVVVHTHKRGKRLSRYAHFNSALKHAAEFKKIQDRTEFNRAIDCYMADLLRYSDARCIHVMRLLMIVGKLNFSPFRLKMYDEFSRRCGRYVVINNDENYVKTHVDNITDYSSKMDHILRQKKKPYKFREPCYRYEGNPNFVVTEETYKTIVSGVREALERLKFDPIRDFNENTVGLTEALWNINKLKTIDDENS